MTRLALRGLWDRRGRTGLTAGVIVLGVALVVATLLLTGSIGRAFDAVFHDAYRGTDAVVVGEAAVSDSPRGRPDIPAGVVARIRDLPEVADATGQIVDFTGAADQVPLVRADGTPVPGDPAFGFGIDPDRPRFNPFTLTEGRWAEGPREVVLDGSTAETAGVGVGDRIVAAGAGGPRRMTVVGLARFGDLDTVGGVTIALFDVPTAQALTGRRGADLVSVSARPGTSPEALAARLREVLPAGFTARTGAEQADAERSALAFVEVIRWFLLGFAGVSLLAGAIVIANALSISVAQRTRELATLRMIGATRRQVMRQVMTEALVLGLVASAAGVAAGYGLVHGMTALFRALGLDLPGEGFPLEPPVVAAGLVTGTVVTLGAALAPALRATRVAPVAAVQGAEGARQHRGRVADLVGLAGIAVAAAALGSGLTGAASGATRGALVGVGVGALLLGTAALTPRAGGMLAVVAALPSRLGGGVAGSLAAENARRDPRRTGAAAAALMVGLALVVFVAVLGSGLKSAERDAVLAQVSADRVVAADLGFRGLPTTVGDAVSRAPGVTVASGIRSDRARVAGGEVDVSGVDPATVGRVLTVRGDAGPDAAALVRPGTVLVTAWFADAHGLTAGETVTVATGSGAPARLRVAGVISPPRFDSLLGDVVLHRDRFDALFPGARDGLVLVRLAPGADDAGIRAAVAGHPGAEVMDPASFADGRAADIDGALNILYVLLAVAVVVAALGLAGTQALAVHERRREIGTLRAIGMSRRQARRMVRQESVITGLVGAGLGIPVGVVGAAAVGEALSEYGVGLHVSAVHLAAVALAAVAAGVVAAARPARRVARLDVLDALAAE